MQTPATEKSTHRADGPGYTVGEAAAIVGISPSTVRLYEKSGLLNLPRTTGGRRYFTEDHLNTLKHIRLLRETQGLSLQATRRELQRAGQVRHRDAEVQAASAVRSGPRLRVLRQNRGLTLNQVAERTGLSISFLSSFERGLTGISMANLQLLISIYGSSLVEVFSLPELESRRLVRATDRPCLTLSDGAIVVESLAVVPRRMEVQLWTIQPFAGSEGMYSSSGETVILLLSGYLEVTLGELTDYVLGPGDCLSFSSSEPHRWQSTGDEPAVVLSVNTLSSF